MNTNTMTFEEVNAAYEAMILSDDDTKVDPTLMEGYEDKLEDNSRALKARTDKERKADDRATFIVDLKTHAIFFASFAGTVFVGYKVGLIYDWIFAII